MQNRARAAVRAWFTAPLLIQKRRGDSEEALKGPPERRLTIRRVTEPGQN